VLASVPNRYAPVLSREALEFVADLAHRFDGRRRDLLARRGAFHESLHAGHLPDLLPATRSIREAEWTVASPPPDLVDRRVEITGPVDRKMVINALNSGARVYMADFEDAHSPTWDGTLAGQLNLIDAVRRRIDFRGPDGREYRLWDRTATLMVRPRGWHLDEKHVVVDDRAVSASLFDFGLFFYHNARELLARGTGPYFYLPKLEHYEEAQLWNDVFVHAQERLGIPRGTIRATVLIETLPAVFEMDEILWALREHSAGLNCGRWDYIFSFIKQFRDDPRAVLPDRSTLTMDRPFLRAYSELLVRTCHRRGAHAMGGMAAQIPIKNDPAAHDAAIAKVVQDKEREVRAGHDGTWVAHPGLVPIAAAVFDRGMPGPHQIARLRSEVTVTPADLVQIPDGPVTREGLRRNARVALRYLESWLRGTGCVPIDHLMEDAATVEISRSQIWQWIHHGASMQEGGRITREAFREVLDEEVRKLQSERGGRSAPGDAVDRARALLDEVVGAREFPEFLTVRAYEELGEELGEPA
jgi:malate synthase